MSSSCNDLVHNQNRKDPTRTTTIRRRYAQRLRGQLAKLSSVIRSGVAERDIFGLREESRTLGNQQDPTPPPPFDFATDDQKIEAFMAWLERQEERGVLDVISRNDNEFIRAAYQRGLTNANRDLRAAGEEVDRDAVDLFNLPVHQDAVQRLYTRNFQELQGITNAVSQQISRELADGFSQGQNPTKIARSITDRVDKIGKTRSTVLARTEVIRAHTEGNLNRYERFGVEQVGLVSEWLTAQDNRVCPICQNLEGQTFTIEEAREETITLDRGDVAPFVPDNRSADSFTGSFPVRPPAHPQCRCRLTVKRV